jgi:hypothetical protein
MSDDPFRPRSPRPKDETTEAERIPIDEDYEVVFVYDKPNSVFVKVLYRTKNIGEARFDDKKHVDVAKFARDEVKDHRKAMKLLVT